MENAFKESASRITWTVSKPSPVASCQSASMIRTAQEKNKSVSPTIADSLMTASVVASPCATWTRTENVHALRTVTALLAGGATIRESAMVGRSLPQVASNFL